MGQTSMKYAFPHTLSTIVFATLALAAVVGVFLTGQAFAVDYEVGSRVNASHSLVAQQARKRVINAVIFQSDAPKYKALIADYDVTGDGKADKVKMIVTPRKGEGFVALKFRLFVNGRMSYESRGLDGIGFFTTGVEVKYLRLKNGAPFLFVKCSGMNGDGTHELLQWKRGRFTVVVSQDFVDKDYGTNRHVENATAKGNTIKVKYGFESYTLGYLSMVYSFAYKSGTLKRENSKTSALSYCDDPYKPFVGLRYAVPLYKTPRRACSQKDVRIVKMLESELQLQIEQAYVKHGKLAFSVLGTDVDSGWIGGATSLRDGKTMFDNDRPDE